LALASWDLCRFLVSVLVAAEALKVDSGDAIILCHRFLDAYAYVVALGEGKARRGSLEQETAPLFRPTVWRISCAAKMHSSS
jgi:uncharacterized protein (DUF2252 family)